MNIREAIRQIIKEEVGSRTFRVATVVSVQGATCTVKMDSGTEIAGIRLQTDPSAGVLIVPKIGSNVLLGNIESFDFSVLMFSAVDSMVFLDGTLGGLIKIEDLVSKINNLESKVNDLVNFTATHTHTGVTTGSGASGPTSTPVTGSLTPTTRVDIENTKITHGE